MSEHNISVSPSPNSIDTLIGAGMRVEGRVACAGVLRIQGGVQGDVACEDRAGTKGFLVVDGSGSVTGKVSANHIAVRGHVTGPLQSSMTIEIHPGGVVDGDVAFNQLAVHAGGLVNGLLDYTPVVSSQGPGQERLPQAPAATPYENTPVPSQRQQSASKRKIAGVAALAALILLVAWFGRAFMSNDSPAEIDTQKENAAPSDVKESPPVSATSNTKVAVPPTGAAETSPPRVPDEKSQGKVVTIKGANPSRPPGVFLLVPNESTVLYRKKLEDPGDGARIAISQGQKMSVAVAQDELVRVAKGTDVVIYFQGQKVPENVVESGSWIRFVPR